MAGGEEVLLEAQGGLEEERGWSGVRWEEGNEGEGGRCGRGTAGDEGAGPGGEDARGGGDGGEEEAPTVQEGEDHALEACASGELPRASESRSSREGGAAGAESSWEAPSGEGEGMAGGRWDGAEGSLLARREVGGRTDAWTWKVCFQNRPACT